MTLDSDSIAPLYKDASTRREPRLFTVMLPIVRSPEMLPHAVQSVLAQTESDFELCIISDGAPEHTFTRAHELAQHDARIKVFSFPKGERHGELHRDAVLRGSSAQFVAQLGDDDLWLPNHLATLRHLLYKADFVSLPQIQVFEQERLIFRTYFSLKKEEVRTGIRENRLGFFGPSECGYRLEAYRSLPVGWSPAPTEWASDQFMWSKFMAANQLRFTTGTTITSVKFGAWEWRETPFDKRATIIASFAKRNLAADSWRGFVSSTGRRYIRHVYRQRLDATPLAPLIDVLADIVRGVRGKKGG